MSVSGRNLWPCRQSLQNANNNLNFSRPGPKDLHPFDSFPLHPRSSGTTSEHGVDENDISSVKNTPSNSVWPYPGSNTRTAKIARYPFVISIKLRYVALYKICITQFNYTRYKYDTVVAPRRVWRMIVAVHHHAGRWPAMADPRHRTVRVAEDIQVYSRTDCLVRGLRDR
jgi:hypothetical protein